MKKLICTLAISLYAFNVQCGDLTIILTQPPPFRVTVSSFWKVSLKNSDSSRVFHLRLHGSATVVGESSPYVSATTNDFDLYIPSGSTLTPVPSALLNNVQLEGHTTSIMTTGSLPAGQYNICINVIDINNNSNNADTCLLALDGSINYSIQNFSYVNITSPLNETEVESIYPVFTWTPPSITAGINYTLNIYEMVSTQTPYDAVVSNREFFQFKNIRSTVFRYPEISRKFSGGKRYAVQVKAYVDTAFISQSEIIYFIYKNLITSEPDTIYKKKNMGILYDPEVLPNGASNSNNNRYTSSNYGLNSVLDYQLSDTAGPFSNLEKDFARINLIPKIKFNDIPFDLNLFYPTDNSSSKQPMYNASLILNQDSLNSVLANSVEVGMNARSDEIEKEISLKGESNRESIENRERKKLIEQLPGRLKTFSNFLNLGLGFNLYPQYSDYTVSGAQIKGLNLEYNPGNFYLALAGPYNNKAIVGSTYQRYMVTGRIGYGKKDYSHIYMTMMYAQDAESSIEPVINSTQILTPQENFLVGLQGDLNLFNNKLKLRGEAAGSGITNDLQAPGFDVNSLELGCFTKSAYNFFDIFININSSTSASYFYKFSAIYDEVSTSTKLIAELERIQPGYVSLGSPDKADDKFQLKFSAESKFFNNQLSARASLKRIEDNLGGIYKAFTTEQWFLSFLLNLRFKNYPTFTVNYSPQILKNDAVNNLLKLSNFNNNLNITASYPFRISGTINNTLLTFYLNNSNTFEDKYNNSQWGINFLNSVYFNNPLWITGSLGYSDASADTNSATYFKYNNYSAEFNLGYTFSEYVQNYAGLSYAYSPDRNKVLTFYINYILKIFKNININMRLEDNVIKNKEGNSWQSNYLDVIFKGQVSWDLY